MTSLELTPRENHHLTESACHRQHALEPDDEEIYPQFRPSGSRLPLPPSTHPLGSSYNHGRDSGCPRKNHYYVNIPHESISPTGTGEVTRESSVTDWEEKSSSSARSSSVDSFANGADEANRYNRLKLGGRAVNGAKGWESGKVAVAIGGRSRKMHYRTALTDSESSSTSILSVDSLDAKLREIEHYNRLKLNLDRLPQNKKALRGLRVLNKIPSLVSRHQASPPPASQISPSRRSSRHRDRRRTSEESQQNLQRQESSTKASRYKNESHVNKLHSVSGQPVRTPSSTWGSRPRSNSTGDMVKQIGRGNEERIDSGSDRQQRSRRTVRSKSFNDIRSRSRSARNMRPQRMTRHDYSDPRGPAISSTPISTPSRDQRGGSNASEKMSLPQHRQKTRRSRSEGNIRGMQLQRKVKASESFTGGTHVSIETGTPSLSPAPTSPLHQMHHSQVEPLSPPTPALSVHGVPFLDPIVSIKCDSEGGDFCSDTHDFKISIPKGAIKKRATVEIQIGLALHGPFKFPRELRPVSPILWLCSTPETKLRKPVEIMLPHYLDTSLKALSNAPDSASRYNVQFLKASDASISSGGETTPSKAGGSTTQASPFGVVRQYHFQPTDGEEWFWSNENHGTLQTKHLCFICIAASETMARPSYCLVTVIPRPITEPTWKINYCVTYWLKSCIEMVRKQYEGEDVELLPPRMFRIGEKGPQAKVEVQFQREITTTGWILALESNSKIRASEIDFWSREEGERESPLHCIGRFPPRFTIRVHGEDAIAASVAVVSFTGTAEDLKSEVILPIRNKSGGSSHKEALAMVQPSQPPTSTRHCYNCICMDHGEEGDRRFGDYDHLPALANLDQTHVQLTFHNGRVDIPSDGDLATVAQQVADNLREDWAVLQAQLEVPDHIMLDVLQERTILKQVLRMLKEWRQHSKDCSKAKLSECLWKTDARLRGAAKGLLRT